MHLQKVWETHKDRGVVVLGLNSSDAPAIAEALLKENGITFPNVLDASPEARRVAFDGYRATAVPMNYIIGRDGRVLSAFTGYAEGDRRGIEAIEKALAVERR